MHSPKENKNSSYTHQTEHVQNGLGTVEEGEDQRIQDQTVFLRSVDLTPYVPQ
ncbi:unnamed protein product [Staurois parvus]|uniref:Uncharacterized protein n=1 Tax=Staurois parvus TaxID=386267 RepID=A0ABN9BX35_9NEOB|nr:unnamed protein product [Staurois parvus]